MVPEGFPGIRCFSSTMGYETACGPIEILLVEDNPGDVRLTTEALKEGKVANIINVATDGMDAMAFLKRAGKYANAPRPDLKISGSPL